MKNLSITAVVFALFCCGLARINLVAQNTESGTVAPVQKTGASATGVSLDQDYIDLLKKRIDVARQKFEEIDAAYKAGQPGGSVTRHSEARIALATAEAGLYRLTGERDLLLAALERKREAAELAVSAAEAAHQAGTVVRSLLLEAELALAEAKYELKKAQESTSAQEPGASAQEPGASASGLPESSKTYVSTRSPDSQALFEKGEQEFKAGRFAEARPLLEKFVESRPFDSLNQYVLFYLGKIAQQDKDWQEADFYYCESVRLFPKGDKVKEAREEHIKVKEHLASKPTP